MPKFDTNRPHPSLGMDGHMSVSETMRLLRDRGSVEVLCTEGRHVFTLTSFVDDWDLSNLVGGSQLAKGFVCDQHEFDYWCRLVAEEAPAPWEGYTDADYEANAAQEQQNALAAVGAYEDLPVSQPDRWPAAIGPDGSELR